MNNKNRLSILGSFLVVVSGAGFLHFASQQGAGDTLWAEYRSVLFLVLGLLLVGFGQTILILKLIQERL